MSLKISIVLPCYNVGRYVADCLDSIYAQDMHEDEFEVICVNDCSTDETRSIIIDYSQKHSNLILIDHSENLTAGGARNTGIKAAHGEYIWFVDPDDMIKPESTQRLYAVAKNKAIDVLLFNHEVVDQDNKFIRVDKPFTDSEICSGQDYVTKYYPNRFSEFCIVWRCFFRTDFLKKKGLWFPKMCKAQDVVFLWKVLLQAETVTSVGETYYVYRSNPYSVASKRLEARVVFSDRILRGYEIYRMLHDVHVVIQPIVRNDMETALRWCANSNLGLLRQMSGDERSKYYNEILKNREVVNSIRPYMNRKQKMVFSTIGGRRLWLFKIELMDVWEKHRNHEMLKK